MSKQANLTAAKKNKNDEFYTRYVDIQNEVNAYHEYNKDFLRNKTLLLPCDDSEWSNFTKFFAKNFKLFGLKKLISTSYANNGEKRGKIFVLTQDTNGDGIIDEKDLKSTYLVGNGDFRSEEVTKLRDEADVIITNPPFSLFRDFIKWVMEGEKEFLVMANNNAITYKEFFPYIKNNQIWLGQTVNKNIYFNVPNGFTYSDTYKLKREIDGSSVCAVPAISWFTNIMHGKRNSHILPMCMKTEDILRFNKDFKGKGMTEFLTYDNYDAIEVPNLKAIPSDYYGVMGVPITFLGIYNPLEFEIMWQACGNTNASAPTEILRNLNHKQMSCDKGGCGVINNKPVYARIFIKRL